MNLTRRKLLIAAVTAVPPVLGGGALFVDGLLSEAALVKGIARKQFAPVDPGDQLLSQFTEDFLQRQPRFSAQYTLKMSVADQLGSALPDSSVAYYLDRLQRSVVSDFLRSTNVLTVVKSGGELQYHGLNTICGNPFARIG